MLDLILVSDKVPALKILVNLISPKRENNSTNDFNTEKNARDVTITNLACSGLDLITSYKVDSTAQMVSSDTGYSLCLAGSSEGSLLTRSPIAYFPVEWILDLLLVLQLRISL